MQTKSDIGTLDRYVPEMLLGRLAAPIDELVEILEGTMVFADVSGFTRLSERLARTGKEGAEHLVDAINACFVFRVGGSHRELLIGGPGTSTVVAMEGHASAGQILLSADTTKLLPRGCLGAESGPGTLLARAPAVGEWAPPAQRLPPSDEAIANTLSTVVRAHLLGGHAAPEHRTAAIAFLQFLELDRLIAQQGAAGAAQRVDELVRLVQDAAARYDVCFLDSDISANGGKIRLSAGAPRVVGDDEERMLLALRQIIDADPPLPIQAGVNLGPVFTGEVGPAYRRWYAVMGDTVNLAARLMSKSPPGHIYATREILQRAKTRFVQTALEPFSVKGKARPVQAWDVGPPLRATTQSIARPQLPLVGREEELEVLRTAIAGGQRGCGTLIELVGETGSGKSRLLAEARRLGRGVRVLRCTCEVYSRDTPYAVWRDLLRQLLGLGWDDSEDVVRTRLEHEVESTEADLRPWLALIAIVLDVELPPSTEVQQLAPESRAAKLHEVVLRFLHQTLVVPTIVEVEHAHLMDAASVALFEALARELESSSWIVLVTRRDEPGGLALADVPHRRIELGPLSPEHVHALALSSSEAAQVPPHVLELAVERSGGSPEFLLDLLAAAAAGNRDELPDSVGAATMARIDALDPRDGAVVRRAAVLGLTFHPRRLADVVEPDMPLPEDGFWDRMEGVFAREDDGHIRFIRPALQETAYASLPFKLRRQLHEAVGLRLEHDQGREPDADPAVLSQHFVLAGDHARAHRYAMAAAKRATGRFSHADPARLYRRAIDAGRAAGLAADETALADAWEQLGGALRSVGEPAAATRALTEARRLLRDDAIAQARLSDTHAQIAERSQALTGAVRWLKRGLRCIDGLQATDATISRARLHSHLGGIRNRQGRWSEQSPRLVKRFPKRSRSASCALSRAPATDSTGRSESPDTQRTQRARGVRSRSTSSSATRLMSSSFSTTSAVSLTSTAAGMMPSNSTAELESAANAPATPPRPPTLTATSGRSFRTRDASKKRTYISGARGVCGALQANGRVSHS